MCGVLGFKKQREVERNEESIIWYEKYNELEIHRKCVRSSAWVSEVLRIWGAKWDLKIRKRGAFLELGAGGGKRDGKYSQEGQTHKIDVVWV